ncbi:MAG: DUF935 family protein [Pseudomonadota bacterium]|nr:DUF935 family protein [Pseudomonadota bacterium]
MSRTRPGTERPKVGSAAASGDSNRSATAYAERLAMPSDRILAMRGGGDLGIYEELKSDGKVKAALEQRRNAVIAREWRVEPGGTKRIDQKAADHFSEQLIKVGFDRVTDLMLWGVFYGYSVAEVVWTERNGLLAWEAVKVRNRRKFRFGANGELRKFDPASPVNGTPAPAPYFWHLATGADNDDEPYGMGLAHWCYWYVLFKRQGLRSWLTYLDKFASPTALGKFPGGASQAEINRLLQALYAIRSDSAVAIPEGMSAELIEAARNGTGDYKTLHETMNGEIERIIIGQTAGSTGTPGKLGGEDLQGAVRQDIIKADADLICESLNMGPAVWLTEHNFAGAAPPRVYRVIEDGEDANQLAERDQRVKAMGFKPGLAYVKETYGEHWEEVQAAAEDGRELPAALPTFSERVPPTDYLSALAAQVADKTGGITDDWVATIRAEVLAAQSFDDLLMRLADLQTSLPIDQLGDVLSDAFGLAHRAGMADVLDDAKDNQNG